MKSGKKDKDLLAELNEIAKKKGNKYVFSKLEKIFSSFVVERARNNEDTTILLESISSLKKKLGTVIYN